MLRAFPDARFVMTHRDPTDVLLSVADVYADIGAMFTDTLDRAYIGRLNVEQWSKGIERVISFRENGGNDRFYDIDFRAMQADPVGEVRGLYEWLDEPVSAPFEQRMEQWSEVNAAHRGPTRRSDPKAFGLDSDVIRPLFADYVHLSADWTAHNLRE